MTKPKLSKSTIEKLSNGEKVIKGKYEYEVKTEWENELKVFFEVLYRWDENNDYESWELGPKGIWEFEK